MAKTSAGILLHRVRSGLREVFLVHPGGPFWARKDDGAWTIPKGEIDPDETPLAAAVRELKEETGFEVTGPFVDLGTVRQSGGKTVQAFAAEADVDPARLVSTTFSLEWPPKSGRIVACPEVDRAAWFSLAEAARKMNAAQAAFLLKLPAATESGIEGRNIPR